MQFYKIAFISINDLLRVIQNYLKKKKKIFMENSLKVYVSNKHMK